MLEIKAAEDISRYYEKIISLGLDRDTTLAVESFDKGRVNGYGLFHLDSECVFLDYIEDGGDILLFDGIARTVLFKAMLSGIDKAELSQNQIEKYKMLGFVQNNYKTIDSIGDFLSKCKSCGK